MAFSFEAKVTQITSIVCLKCITYYQLLLCADEEDNYKPHLQASFPGQVPL